MIPHDQMSKELFSIFFGDFVDLFLPDLANYLDKNSLVLLDKELFTDLHRGQRRVADLVVKARFRDQDAFFLILTEPQAQYQLDFGQRLFCYFSLLTIKYHLPVYPIAIFSHRARRPEPAIYQVQFPNLEVLRFQFRCIQLSRLNWRDFIHRPNPVAAALMSRMGMTREERPRVKLECLRMLATLKLDRARSHLISGFIDNYLRLNAEEMLIFQKQSDTLLTKGEKKKVMEITTSWMEEGLQKGRQEGRREGQQEVILHLLQRRVGKLTTASEQAVRALPDRQLQRLMDALFHFTSPADLQSWLRTQRAK